MVSPLHGEENLCKSDKKVIQPLPGAEDTALQYLFSHHLLTVPSDIGRPFQQQQHFH